MIHGRYLYAIKVKTLIVLMSWEFKTKYDKIDHRQVSIARFIVTVTILGAIELASFGFINMMLLTMSRIETNPGPCTNPTNDDTLKWFENLQKEGRFC